MAGRPDHRHSVYMGFHVCKRVYNLCTVRCCIRRPYSVLLSVNLHPTTALFHPNDGRWPPDRPCARTYICSSALIYRICIAVNLSSPTHFHSSIALFLLCFIFLFFFLFFYSSLPFLSTCLNPVTDNSELRAIVLNTIDHVFYVCRLHFFFFFFLVELFWNYCSFMISGRITEEGM